MNKFNQFDMEQQIMTCWNICEDLETLCEGVLDRNMKPDSIANVLLGMKDLYQLKFETLFEQFEQFVKEMYNLRKNADNWPFPAGVEEDEDELEKDIRYSRMEKIVDDN